MIMCSELKSCLVVEKSNWDDKRFMGAMRDN